MTFDGLSHVLWASKPELYEELAQRDSFPAPAVLLRERLLELRGSNDAGLDQVKTDAWVAFGPVQEQLEEIRQVQRTEWFDDEGRSSNGARKGSTFRIVARGEQNDADAPRIRSRFEFAADGVAIAALSLEVHVKQQDFRTMALGEGEAFIRCRRLDDRPALGRQSHPRGRTQAGVVISDEDRGVAAAMYRPHANATVRPVERSGKQNLAFRSG